MIFEHDGKKYEFRGEYRYPQQGESFLNDTGYVMPRYPNMSGRIRAIIHPVPVTHTFGGVTFEETGEFRCAAPNEWFFTTGFTAPSFNTTNTPSKIPYRIIKPV